MTYSPLHVHLDIDSNLHSPDSIVKIPELMKKLKEFGIKSCAVTGHDSISGHQRFWNACRENDIKPLLGWEGYLDIDDGEKYYHILFIAKSMDGLINLQKLTTRAWLENYYYRPRVKLEWLSSLSKDLIVTDACLGGVVKKYLLKLIEAEQSQDKTITKEIFRQLDNIIKKLKNIFKDNFYIELQAGEQEEQIKVNKRLIKLADYYNLKLVCSSDIHYLRPENKKTHETFLQSRNDTERELGNFYDYTYLMTYEEMFNILSKQIGEIRAIEIIENTNKIAASVGEYELKNSPILPLVKIPHYKFEGFFEQFYSSHEYIKRFAESPYEVDRYWLYMIEQGHLKNLAFDNNTYSNITYINRINRELQIKWNISEALNKRLSQYYAGLSSDIDLIKSCNSLVGVGRGSTCGFYTCYCSEITQLDPIEYNIPEWRHLDEQRKELPDIDIDVEPQLLNLILEKLQEKHGKEKVIRVGTFKSITSKEAIQSTSRALKIPIEVAQKISDLVPIDRGKNWTIAQCLEGDEEKGYEPVSGLVKYNKEYPELFYYAQQLEGLICGRSKHASAVFIYDNDYTLYNAAMKTSGGIIVTQLEMNDSTERGGTKYDFLVTEQQTLKHIALDNIDKRDININEKYNELLHPRVLDLNNIDIYKEVFHKARTKTVFQWNSQIGINALHKLLPNNLTELSAGNNIIRLIGNAIDKYIKYKNNPESFDIDYSLLTLEERKLLKDLLVDSCYVAITQEDMMRISMAIGFTMKQANNLRKAVAKKKPKLLKETKIELFQAARKQGYRPIFLYTIWNDFIKPLEGYAFSTNHTYPYSAEGVQDAYLLMEYPLEWYNSCLTVASQAFTDDTEEAKKNKSSDYGKLATLIADIQSDQVNVTSPDINKADFMFKVWDDKIMFGLKGLTNVGDWVVEQIINNRPYTNFEDFINKNVLNINENDKKLEKRIIFSLIGSGCFNGVEPFKTKKELFIKYIKLTYSPIKQLDIRQGQELFEYGLIKQDIFENKDRLREYIKTFKESLVRDVNRYRMNKQWQEYLRTDLKGDETDWEFNAMNFYLKDHAMKKYSGILSDFNKLSEETKYTMESYQDKKTKETKKYRKYDITKIGGTVLDKEPKDKKLVLLTPTGTVTVKMYDDHWNEFSELFNRGNKLIVFGYRWYDNFKPKLYKQKGLFQFKTIMLLEDYLAAVKKSNY